MDSDLQGALPGTQAVAVGIHKISPLARVPEYQTEGAAGADLYAAIESALRLEPGERVLVPTGLSLEIPDGYEAQVRSRSGNALKFGIVVLNSPGTIDSDYRGELKVLVANLGAEVQIVSPGDRIAQIVFAPVIRVAFSEKAELTQTSRGYGGFGSTGRS